MASTHDSADKASETTVSSSSSANGSVDDDTIRRSRSSAVFSLSRPMHSGTEPGKEAAIVAERSKQEMSILALLFAHSLIDWRVLNLFASF